jgi:hypothetical protein
MSGDKGIMDSERTRSQSPGLPNKRCGTQTDGIHTSRYCSVRRKGIRWGTEKWYRKKFAASKEWYWEELIRWRTNPRKTRYVTYCGNENRFHSTTYTIPLPVYPLHWDPNEDAYVSFPVVDQGTETRTVIFLHHLRLFIIFFPSTDDKDKEEDANWFPGSGRTGYKAIKIGYFTTTESEFPYPWGKYTDYRGGMEVRCTEGNYIVVENDRPWEFSVFPPKTDRWSKNVQIYDRYFERILTLLFVLRMAKGLIDPIHSYTIKNNENYGKNNEKFDH